MEQNHVRVRSSFTLIPDDLLDHSKSGLSDNAIRVYLAIRKFAHNQTGVAFPSHETIGKVCGCSASTVKRSVNKLIEAGWLSKQRRTDSKTGAQTSNFYVVETQRSSGSSVLPSADMDYTPVHRCTEPQSTGDLQTRLNELDPDELEECSTSVEVERFSMEVQNLCSFLADWIVHNGGRNPNISKTWLDDMDKIIRIDKRSVQEIREIIEWCQRDNFWHRNILSPGKLRTKFDRLVMDKNAENRPNNRRVNPNADVIDRMLAKIENENQRKELNP